MGQGRLGTPKIQIHVKPGIIPGPSPTNTLPNPLLIGVDQGWAPFKLNPLPSLVNRGTSRPAGPGPTCS